MLPTNIFLRTILLIAVALTFSHANAQAQHGNKLHLWDRSGYTIIFSKPNEWSLAKLPHDFADRTIYPQRVNFVLLSRGGARLQSKAASPFLFVSTEVRGNESVDGLDLAKRNLEIKREFDYAVKMVEKSTIKINGTDYRVFDYVMPKGNRTERVAYIEFSHGILGLGASSTNEKELDALFPVLVTLATTLKIVPPKSAR